MKKCPDCGKPYEDVFDECPECAAVRFGQGEEMPFVAVRDMAAAPSISGGERKRPTGETVLVASVASLVMGLLAIFLSNPFSDFFILGLGLANLGMLGLITGYIVYAISFLPGKSD